MDRERAAVGRPLPSAIKAYAMPLFLFSLAMFYQLVVTPRSFPPSHYDALKIKRYSSIEEVEDAYEKISSNWNSGAEIPSTDDFLKIRYAYELLTNPVWKRDYDIYDIDEQRHVLEKVKTLYAGKSYSEIGLPLLDAAASAHGDYAFKVITFRDFRSLLNDSKPWIVQIYSRGSIRCAQFFGLWKEIDALLDGVANTGMVELGDIQLATSLAERKPTRQFSFRNGLPSLVAVPPECKSYDCLLRFEGDLSMDAVGDWFATTVLGLPRIPYHSKDSLTYMTIMITVHDDEFINLLSHLLHSAVQNFLQKSSPHKVKVIFFSKTGQRATPFVRQTAKNYWAYASFAFVLWRQEDFSFWWSVFDVESAPAIVFIKDPGVKPIVFHGSFNNSWFLDVMEKNKQQVLPQLRSVASMELGCDPRGHSRAGNDTLSWYCVILAGRQGPELLKMRETMRRVQELLSNDNELGAADTDQSSFLAAAFKNKRVTFAWLDGEAQQKYCLYYLHVDAGYDACGPRRGLIDVPRLFIILYKKNTTEDDAKVERKQKNVWNLSDDEDMVPISQLVSRYNGTNEIPEIIRWISVTIQDGDTRDLPVFRSRAVPLVPEDSDPIWSRGAQSILSRSSGIKHNIYSIINRIYGCVGDPRIGPILLLGALLSFGTTWLTRSQAIQSRRPIDSTTEDETRQMHRDGTRNASKDPSPSITDVEPKDAYQMPLSDSD